MYTLFQRTASTPKADWLERVGSHSLGLFHMAMGKTYHVTPKMHFTHQERSLHQRVCACIAIILLAPVVLLLALVGCLAYTLSKTHAILETKLRQQIQHVLDIQKRKASPNWKQEQEQAAICLQKHIRGYLERKNFLSRSLFPRYKDVCGVIEHHPNRVSKIPAGKASHPVFAPENMSEIIAKQSGTKLAKHRFHNMRRVRKLCAKLGLSKLMIPKARLFHSFLIEERLPITPSTYANLAIYQANPQLFDQAIKELLQLCTRMTFLDLFGSMDHPFQHVPGMKRYVRYDNIPMTVINGKGHLVLVDLEDITMEPQKDPVEMLVQIFPLHADLIKTEAQRLGIKFDKEKVYQLQQSSLNALSFFLHNHAKRIRHLNIDPKKNPKPKFHLNEQQLKELGQRIQEKMSEELRYYNAGETITLEMAKQLAKVTIQALEKELGYRHEAKKEKFKNRPATWANVLEIRSPIFNVDSAVLSEIANSMTTISDERRQSMAFSCLKQALSFLVSEGFIYFYSLRYYTRQQAHLAWVRY